MPLYDCVLLLKPNVAKEAVVDLVSRVGKHVFKRNGVVTQVKSLGDVQLGYGIKKIDGRFFQISMMATPNINKELHYLNKEDRLLRWLLVKQRDTRYEPESFYEEQLRNQQKLVREGSNEFDSDDDDDSMKLLTGLNSPDSKNKGSPVPSQPRP